MNTPDQNILREIKSSFRQTMNDDLSDGMRRNGLIYRMNFGVPSPRIKLIAERFEQDADLATYLWNEDVRESKMLATYLYPADKFTEEEAMKWCSDLKYTEIADQLCKNLLVRQPYATHLSKKLIDKDSNILIYTGYRLMIQLLIDSQDIQIDTDFINKSRFNAVNGVSYVNNVMLNLMQRLVESGQLSLSDIEGWRDSDNHNVNNIYQLLSMY